MGRRIIELYDAILEGGDAEISVRSTLQRRAGYIEFNGQAAFKNNLFGSSAVDAGGPTPWTNPGNFAGSPDGNYATVAVTAPATTTLAQTRFSNALNLTGYGFAVPGVDTISGISLLITGFEDLTLFGGNFSGIAVQLTLAGNPIGIAKQISLPNAVSPVPVGSASDMWGTTLTPAIVNDPTFGISVKARVSNGFFQPARTVNFSLDAGQMTVFQNGAPGYAGTPQKFCAFQPTSLNGTIIPIVDTTANVFNSRIGQVPVSLVAKTNPTQTSFFAVGAFLYMGNASFQQKWDADVSQGVTNWGIVMAAGVSTKFSGTAGSTALGFGFTNPWTNINNANGPPDGNYATSPINYDVSGGGTSGTAPQQLNLRNFGFSVPLTSFISSITITITGFLAYTVGSGAQIGAQIVGPGYASSTVGTQIPSSPGSVVIRFVTNLPSEVQVNDPTFGINLQIGAFGSLITTGILNIDAVEVDVNFGPLPITSVFGGGSFAATQGYQHVYCYGNKFDNNLSNPTPASLTTGPFVGAQGIHVNVVASPDPQVNQIRVFRTTDTGTGAVFFELPNSPFPNTTATIVDSALDTQLQVTNAVQLGSLAFSPPPAGLRLMAWYAGRMWGAVGNLLYFSAGPDNAPMGEGNSNWPPNNVYKLPTEIVKLIPLSGGNGMIVVTLDKWHIVQGITNPGFTVNIFLEDVGARQENAVSSDGSTIYIFTSDRQFLQITANGINELSQFVSDITDDFDPTEVYVAQHRSGSQDSRVFLSDGSTQILPYNLMAGAWEPIQTPVDGGGVGAIGSIEIQPGVKRFLKGSTVPGDVVLQRDLQTFDDNGSQYGWSSTFGCIPLADPSQLANVDSVILRMTNAGNLPMVSLLPNDTSGDFTMLKNPVDEPPEGPAPVNHRAKRYYASSGPELWQQMMHCLVKFDFAPSSEQEEILSFGLFPNQSADQGVGQIPQVQGR